MLIKGLSHPNEFNTEADINLSEMVPRYLK